MIQRYWYTRSDKNASRAGGHLGEAARGRCLTQRVVRQQTRRMVATKCHRARWQEIGWVSVAATSAGNRAVSRYLMVSGRSGSQSHPNAVGRDSGRMCSSRYNPSMAGRGLSSRETRQAEPLQPIGRCRYLEGCA